MARTISTGIVDIQLVGLPDVKRQLKDIPRLMDGVSKSAESFGRAIGRSMRDATRSIREMRQEATRRMIAAREAGASAGKRNDFFGQTNALITQKSQRAAASQFSAQARARAETERAGQFNLSAVGKLGQFREATLGTKALATLNQEQAALARLANQLDLTDRANRAFIASESERIRVSREAINLEQKRVLDPQGFAAHERQARAKQSVTEGMASFAEETTHAGAIADIEAQEAALNDLVATKKNLTSTDKAYIDQARERLAVHKELLSKTGKMGEKLNGLRAKREAHSLALTKSSKHAEHNRKEVAKLTRQIDLLEKEHKSAKRQLSEFNESLHEHAGVSRAANYRAQQLSFAAQDAVQVFGQTGFAGALHASANNLSMFVQTLDIANPKILAFGAFGVTAAMMALSAWLKNSKKDTDALTDSLDRFAKVAGQRIARQQAGEKLGRGGVSGFASEFESVGNEIKQLQAESETLRRSYINMQDESISSFWNSFWTRATNDATRQGRRAMLEGDAAGMAAARKKFEELWNVELEFRRGVFGQQKTDVKDFLGRVGADQFETIKKTLIDRGLSEAEAKTEVDKYRNTLRNLNDLMARHAIAERKLEENAKRLLDQSFEKGVPKFSRQLQAIMGNGQHSSLQQVQVAEAAAGFRPETLTQAESRTKDYSGAVSRLQKEISQLTQILFTAGADQRSVDAVVETWKDAIQQNRNAIARSTQQQYKVIEAAKARQLSARKMVDSFMSADADQLTSKMSAIRQSTADAMRAAMESGLPMMLRRQKRDAVSEEGRRRIAEIQRERNMVHERERTSLGRFHRTGTLAEKELGVSNQLYEALRKIDQSKLLSPEEKRSRAQVALISAKASMDEVRASMHKVGFTDPKSLHKQIQASLRKSPELKVQEDILAENKATNELNAQILEKIGSPLIGSE